MTIALFFPEMPSLESELLEFDEITFEINSADKFVDCIIVFISRILWRNVRSSFPQLRASYL